MVELLHDLAPTANYLATRCLFKVNFWLQATLLPEKHFWSIPRAKAAAVAAKICKTSKNSPNGGRRRSSPWQSAPFLACLTIINNYLGLGNRICKIWAACNRRHLLRIRNNRHHFFKSDFWRFRCLFREDGSVLRSLKFGDSEAILPAATGPFLGVSCSTRLPPIMRPLDGGRCVIFFKWPLVYLFTSYWLDVFRARSVSIICNLFDAKNVAELRNDN